MNCLAWWLMYAVELLKFYGPHHKDYADCYGKRVLFHLAVACCLSLRCRTSKNLPVHWALWANSVYHHSHNASVITCLPVPVSAKMCHGFKYSLMWHRINICVHIAETGTGRHIIMMHCGNDDMENSVLETFSASVLYKFIADSNWIWNFCSIWHS